LSRRGGDCATLGNRLGEPRTFADPSREPPTFLDGSRDRHALKWTTPLPPTDRARPCLNSCRPARLRALPRLARQLCRARSTPSRGQSQASQTIHSSCPARNSAARRGNISASADTIRTGIGNANLEDLFMAKGATVKDKAASRGRASQAKRRSQSKPDRQSRDSRTRSAAADERKRERRSRSPEKARNPRARNEDSDAPKNKRERVTLRRRVKE
jgi:hypothetical protein